jgi:hypothetical protein
MPIPAGTLEGRLLFRNQPETARRWDRRPPDGPEFA